MIYNNINQVLGNNFNVIIIGSGPAGISSALKFEEKKIKILMLEAGSDSFSQKSQEYYVSKIFGDEVTDLSSSRLRQFGGTGGIWGGWSKPMETYNLSRWGIDYNQINKHKNQTCSILNINNIFRNSSIDKYFNQIEFQYSPVKFNKKYKNYIAKSKYINLLMNAQATKFSGENDLTKHIEFVFKGDKFKVSSKFFILAAGGIENSRILLYSKSQNRILKNNSNIGLNWMTHPWFIGGYGILKKKELSKFLGKKYIDKEGPLHISSSENLIKDKNILSGSIYMDAIEDKKIIKEIIKNVLCVAPNFGKKVARNIFNKDLKCGNIFMHLEDPANNYNKITLDDKITDSNGIPITNLYYKKSRETLMAAKTILIEFAEICRNLDIGRIAIKESIDLLESYDSLGIYHHIGGTKIGKSINNSVVDKNLKIHGNKNLYVSGSSVFPTAGFSNPTFTIIQLSLRLAEHISDKLIS